MSTPARLRKAGGDAGRAPRRRCESEGRNYGKLGWMQTLRPYQRAALDAVAAKFTAGIRRLILVSPVGSGKSTMAAHAVLAEPGAVLLLAHRDELVQQISERLELHGIEHGLIVAGKDPDYQRVMVASLPTLRNREAPQPDLVIVDECQHGASDSWKAELDLYPQARILGLTATPYRLDKRGLADVFDDVVISATVRELIDLSHLCDVEGFAYQAPDLTGVRMVGGDYDEGALALEYQKSQVIGDVLGRWREHCSGMQSILFAPNIVTSQMYAATFRTAGIEAKHIDGATPFNERRSIIQGVRTGRIQLICNVMVLGEGFDVPELKCLIQCRPTKSKSLWMQMAGRVMRPKADGARAWIQDHADCIKEHGLPTDEQDYTLRQTAPPRPKPLHVCEKCFRAYSSELDECPTCGYPRRKPSTHRGGPAYVPAIAEVDIHAVAAMRNSADYQDRDFRDMLLAAVAKGHDPGAAVHRFKAKYPGVTPSWKLYWQFKERPKEVVKMEQTPAQVFEECLLKARERNHRPGSAVHRFKEQLGEEATPPWDIWRKYVGKDKNWLPHDENGGGNDGSGGPPDGFGPPF